MFLPITEPIIGLTDEAVENKYCKMHTTTAHSALNLPLVLLQPYPYYNAANLVNEAEFKMTYKLKKWLRDNGFPQEYADTLEQHGYFNLNFVAGLKVKVRWELNNFSVLLGLLICFLGIGSSSYGIKRQRLCSATGAVRPEAGSIQCCNQSDFASEFCLY